MENICAGFQEAKDLKDAGFPQGTSFFRWYRGESLEARLVPRHERFQWAAKMANGDRDALCDGYPVVWGTEASWWDAPTVDELLAWKPDAALVAAPGVMHATASGNVVVAGTMADALARAITGK